MKLPETTKKRSKKVWMLHVHIFDCCWHITYSPFFNKQKYKIQQCPCTPAICFLSFIAILNIKQTIYVEEWKHTFNFKKKHKNKTECQKKPTV